MSFSEFCCEFGNTLDGRPFCVSEHKWATHLALIGPTGLGKSRLMRQMMREHRRQRRGFCCIDTGDLATDFLADAAAEVFMEGNYGLLKKIHLVKLDPFRMARYNPWQLHLPSNVHPELRDIAMRFLQHTRVHALLRPFQANTTGATDFLNQARRHRVMTNVFLALSTEVHNRRLAIEDVFIFFDPSHKYHKPVVERIAPLLADEIRHELELLGGFKRLEDLRREVESSINGTRMVLGEGLKQMLSGTGAEPSLSMKEIIERGDYLIVDAQQSSFVNHEQNIAMASVYALDYCDTAMNMPRAKRRNSTLFGDEVPELLGPIGREIGRWLRILRKYGVACCLSFQDLDSMKRDDFDLAPVVLANCGIIVSFRCRWPKDADILSRVLLTGNLSFEPLHHEVERHGGHQFLQIDETSETVKQDLGHSHTTGTTFSSGTNQVHSNSRSTAQNWSHGDSKQFVIGPDGNELSRGRGGSAVRGGGFADSAATANGSSQQSGSISNTTESATEGWAVTIGHKIVPLPIIVREIQETGSLKTAVNDQLAKFIQQLHGLEQRQAVVLAPGMKQAVEIVTAEVKDPFQSIDAQMKAVEAIRRMLYETHDYFFQPSIDSADADKRIAAFLRDDNEADHPIVVERVPHVNGANGANGKVSRNGQRSRIVVASEKNGRNPLD